MQCRSRNLPDATEWVSARLCHHEGCFVTPTYNYPNEKKRIFCVTHKLDGMVRLVPALWLFEPNQTMQSLSNMSSVLIAFGKSEPGRLAELLCSSEQR